MVNAVPNQPVQFSKGEPQAAPTTVSSSAATRRQAGGAKLFGIDRRAFLTVFGLTSFIVLAMAGVYIAMFQRAQTGPLAPTAPQSRPQAAEEVARTCTLSFNVGQKGTSSLTCTKKAYQDELSNTAGTYQLLTEKSSFKPGDTVVYSIVAQSSTTGSTINLTDVLGATGNMTNATFLDSNCGANAYNATSRTLTCPSTLAAYNFRVRINANTANNTVMTNTAQVSDGTNTASCQVAVTVTTTTTTEVVCGDSCDSTRVCPSSQTCSSGKCVLNSCLDSNTTCDSTKCNVITTTNPKCGETCTPSDDKCPDNHTCVASTNKCQLDSCLINGVNCDVNKCVIVEATPTPKATVGCNNTCATNSDCSATNHVCWYGKCRLDSNPNSETCTTPSSSTTTIIQQGSQTVITQPGSTTVVTQPTLPEELPKTGVFDEGLRVLGAGFAAVAIGGLLLLLL